MLTKLALSNLSTRKIRTALTLAAVAVSVSLVVAVTSGYASAKGAIYQFLVTYMGSIDVQISHKSDSRQGVKEDLLKEVSKDPAIQTIYGRLETDTGMLDAEGKPIAGRAAQLIGVDRPADVDIIRTVTDEGAWFDTNQGDVAVIDQQAAQTLKVKVGETILLPGVEGKRRLKVIGLCHKPAILAEHVSWIYLPLRTCQEITNRRGEFTRIMITLKRPSEDKAFAERWEPRLQKIDRDLKVKLARDTRKEMEKNLSGIQFLSYLGGGVAMIVAALIVFATLSMGVTERQRTLAMLRAIGAYRGQVARLVLIEGVALAVIGAILGAPLGAFWTWLLTRWKHDFFSAGLVIDWFGILFGIVVSGLAALLAGLLPAWLASRVSPLDALVPHAHKPSMRGPLIAALCAIPLVAFDPFMAFLTKAPSEVKFYGHYTIGLPGLFLGAFLLAPLFVWLVEKVFGRVIPLILGVQPSLLRQQLTAGIWRAAATGAALMTGLTILIALQTIGQSLLATWRLPDHFPDIFIWTANTGLSEAEWKNLDKTEGIQKGKVLPIAIATPGLPDNWLGKFGAAVMPNATMFFGVDPDLALDMMELEFRDGNPKDATEALKKGDHIIITDEFRVLKGLKVGDKLSLMTNQGRRDFTICGAVWSPGLDVMVSMFEVGRMFEERTISSVFGSVDDAKKYFGKDRVYLFAANLEPGVDRVALLKKVKEQLGERGWKAGDVRKIKYEITQGFSKLLLLLTTIAFASMAVAALGVTNTLMASVRSRQWQFGILRSIGVTRGQLLRLILSEGLLLALVGCVMGIAAGFLLSATALRLIPDLVGLVADMKPPWPIIQLGIGIIFAVSILSSLWPALHAARSEPLSLLQSGRSAA